MRRLISFGLALAALAIPFSASAQTEKIGIFDLAAIHAAPLNAQVVNTTTADGVTTEEIRYDVLPGIRAFAYLSYPVGAKGLATNVEIRNFGAESRRNEAKSGFVGWSVAAPDGNADPNKKDTLGGAKPTEAFTDDPQKSWVYQHVVEQIRGLDYLATRPEVDMKRVVVTGFSWSGFVGALMHALDNRPVCYVTWNSTGYFADPKGNSGDQKSRVTRQQYEMYCPSNYAQYGTQPIYIGNSITDYFATLDGAIDMYEKLKCPKEFAWAPNRYHADTSRKEYAGAGTYMWQFQGNGPKTSKVLEGAFEARAGKLLYKYYVDSNQTLTRTEVLYSYGSPGHWTGRTWHRAPAILDPKDGYVAEIPVYDPAIPVYVVGQIEDPVSKCVGNKPQLYIPKDGGIATPSAVFPSMLMDFEDQSDLYFGSGEPQFVGDAHEGQFAASVTPFADGTVHIMNIEPVFWKGKTELHFWLKGDGQAGPVTLYLMRDSDYFFDEEIFKGRFSTITIVGPSEIFETGWHEYAIPLSKIRDLNKVDALWFKTGIDAANTLQHRKLVIDGIEVK